MDVLGLGALALVAAEWLALGTLSGIDWPTDQAPFWAPRWSLRILVGAALLAMTQLVLAVAGVGFGSIPLVLIGAAAAAGAIRLIRIPHRYQSQPAPMTPRERAGWLILGGILIAASIRAWLVPEAGWDAYSHWGLRAQAFALARTVVDAHSEHEYYPPLVPLLEAWLDLHRGAVSIDLAKTIWAVLGSAFAVCLTWHLRLSVRQAWLAPWLGTAIVLSATSLLENFWTGQADLALTAFLTLATLAVFQAQRATNQMWLIQAAVFAATASLTKFEALPRVTVVVAVLVLEGLLNRRQWGWVWASCLVLLGGAGFAWVVWETFELTHRIMGNAEHIGAFQPLAIGGVLVSLATMLAGVRTGGGVLIAALSWLVGGRYLLSPSIRLVSLVVLGQLAATLLGFLLSDTSPVIAVQTSATRLFEQFMPLALFAPAIALTMLAKPHDRRDL